MKRILVRIGLLALTGVFLTIISAKALNYFTSNEQHLKFAEERLLSNGKVFNGTVRIEDKDGNLLYEKSKNMEKGDLYFNASISKLYTHTIVFQLIDEGKITGDTPVGELLKGDAERNILSHNGKIPVNTVTVRMLLDQTSGFPDYETEKIKGKPVILDEIKKKDFPLFYEDALKLTIDCDKWYETGKARYSNLNALMLGKIAEELTGDKLTELYKKKIFIPLGLNNTFAEDLGRTISEVYAGKNPVTIKQYAFSAPAAGGIISDSKDSARFLRVFLRGELFSNKNIENIDFKPIQFIPLKYGNGMMACEMNPIMSPVIAAPLIKGHSGATGSFAFYCPEKEVYITGTINQADENPFQTMYFFLNAY